MKIPLDIGGRLSGRILFLTLLSVPSFAQNRPDSISSPDIVAPLSITIQTNIEGARVVLDDDSVGITPVTFHAAPGRHRVKLIPPDAANWLSEPLVDSLSVGTGPEQTFRYSFPQKFLILSLPSGAEVVLQDSVIGTTPVMLKAETALLRLRKKGYEDVPLDFANSRRGILSTQMKKLWESDSGETIFKDSEVEHSPLKIYLSGVATILAGATSAYFKVKADNTYGEYVRSGDPARLDEVNRLDTAAGMALAATQISLGLFTYFILSE